MIGLFKKLAAGQGLAILLTTHNTAFGAEADHAITFRRPDREGGSVS